MYDNCEHPPEPGPTAFSFARELLLDISTRLHSIRDELISGRFDASLPTSAINWTAYCMILIGDNCAAASDLCEPRHVRVLTTIARTTYEYCIAQLFVERHPEIARLQFTTFYGRSLRRIVEMHPANAEAIAQYDEWLRDASLSGADSYSGNFNNKAAILEVDGEEKGGVSPYGLFYSNTSIFAHPDAAGYSDIFDFDFDGSTLSVYLSKGSTHHAYDAIFLIIMHSARALKAAAAQLKLKMPIDDLASREHRAFRLHFKV